MHAGLEVQAQRGAQVDVVLGREVQRAGRAPAAHLDVGVFVGAHRHRLVRQVGHRHQHQLQFGLQLLQPHGGAVQLVADAGHLRHHGVGGFALGLELADLLAQRIAPGLQVFSGGLDALAFGFECAEALDVEEGLRRLAQGQAGDHRIEVAAEQVDVEHGRSSVMQQLSKQAGPARPAAIKS